MAFHSKSRLRASWQLYALIALPVLYLLVFKYIPMTGVLIAFKRYMPLKGILGSPWIGLANFRQFFGSYLFGRLMTNTIGISALNLIITFPVPILLALALHYAIGGPFKKTVQMVTYAPHFISNVVMIGIMMEFLSMRGFANNALRAVGIPPINFMGEQNLFWWVYVFANVWQHTGYASIVYLAALSGIDPSLHEAAKVDGASRLQRILTIDLPSILPTAVILLILNTGRIMEVGFERVFLMQNPLNLSASEVIQTYVYKTGIAGSGTNMGYPAAIDLFRSVINFSLILIVNRIAKRSSETSLW